MSSNGNRVDTWDAFKSFKEAYDLPIYYIQYENKYDIAVYISGVRHYYIMHNEDTEDVVELLAMVA